MLFRLLLLAPALTPAGDPPVDFGDQVRPILARSCLPCHGFDPSTREAGVRLDTFQGATFQRPRGLGAAIVPGDPWSSVLIEKVSETDPYYRMPPEGEPLTEEEVALLTRWIEEGAEYERHWSLVPPADVEAPAVDDPDWSGDPIDRFVYDAMRAAGLEPAPEADRRALLRRLSFDLIGLPPTIEEVRAFEADGRDDALERQVDRLLASPHFGERWGRHWLDLMRYAETYAHEFDYPIPEAYRYRDYVITALNEDVPYDDFVREHIAGDLLPEPRIDPHDRANASIRGTGWWWLSQGTHAPVDVRADEAERIDNQLDVLGKAFLGTTIACARCHDHKFDPIRQSEYYALAGFVQSSRRQLAYLDPGGEIEAAASEMRELNAVVRAELAELAKARAEEFADSAESGLEAAAQVLFGSPVEGEPAPRAERPLFSFDGEDWSGFEVEGDAFGPGPQRAGPEWLHSESTAVGRGFATSHFRLEGDGSREADVRTGLLRSPEFDVDRRYLSFLIAGGRHAGLTGLRVVVDGEVVADETGVNDMKLVERSVDLGAFQGRRGRIEIYDEATGAWGNICVDEVRLSDDGDGSMSYRRSPAAVAAESGLEADEVARWADAVAYEDESGSNLFDYWIDEQGGARVLPEPAQFIIGGALALPAAISPWMAHLYFDTDRTGWAFGEVPTEAGQWRMAGGRIEFVDKGMLDSGAVSDQLVGTMRTPTFTISCDQIHVEVRGRGTVRFIVDGYTMDEYNALLFESARHVVDSEDWKFVTHDVSKWVGHRAHYELHDERRDGSLQARLWHCNEGPDVYARHPNHMGVPTFGGAAEARDLVLRALREGREPNGARLVTWMLDHSLLDFGAQSLSTEARRSLDRIAVLEEELGSAPRALALAEGSPEDAHILRRGDSGDPGDRTRRKFPGALGGGEILGDAGIERLWQPSGSSGRDELAESILAEANPLAARVPANRVWQHLLGRGLCPTPDDFGLLGAVPSHLELLDHLALRLRDELDWSLKDLIRAIVLTRTYRTAVGEPSELELEVDPDGVLLATRRPRRLDAESLRDSLLAVSGRLDPTPFGPSVPVHLTDFQQGRGRPGTSGPLDGDGRRSIYLEVRRNFPTPFLRIFDCPDPHSTRGARAKSNVPAQGLALMNDPFVHGQAELLAERAAARAGEGAALDGQVRALFELALQREPEAEELEAFIAADLELADLAHVLVQSKEFSFLE